MNLLRKLGLMIKAMLATAGRVALMPVRLADGTLTYVWQFLRGATAPVTVDVEAPEPERTPEPEAAPDQPEVLGEWARRAARSIIESDFVLDKTVPKKISDWAFCLAPHERRLVAASTDEAVGRHLMGLEPLVGLDGLLPLIDPATQAARAAEVVAARLDRVHRMQRAQTPSDAVVTPFPSNGRLCLVA